MTISSKLTTINDSLGNIKSAIINKGQVPSGDITTFAAAIANISGGGSVNNTSLTATPLTSSQIFYPQSPYTGFGSVTINAVTSTIDSNISAENIKKDVVILGVTGSYEGSGGSGPIGELFQGSYDENGVYTMPYNLTWTGDISFPGIKTISNYSATSGGAFASYLYHQASQTSRLKCRLIIGTVSFPDLETVTGSNAFMSFCNGQTRITAAYFPKLYSISSSNFNYAFQGCTNLTNIYFNAVTSSTASAFKSALGTSMLSGVTNCKVHFPSNLSSIIGSTTFGGSGNTGTVFDLPATS